jgi:hypothetical protein
MSGRNYKTVRADLSLTDWDALDAQAREQGLSIGIHTRNLILAGLKAGQTGATSSTPNTHNPYTQPPLGIEETKGERWARLTGWMQTSGLRYPGTPTTRAEVYDWARTHGFVPK